MTYYHMITLDTAKLAKIKGYDPEATIIYYDPPKNHSFHGKISSGPGYARKYNYYRNTPKDDSERIHATSQDELQKWLRDNHKIYIRIIDIASANGVKFHVMVLNYNANPMEYEYLVRDDIKISDAMFPLIFDSYEDALEIGLQKALNYIK